MLNFKFPASLCYCLLRAPRGILCGMADVLLIHRFSSAVSGRFAVVTPCMDWWKRYPIYQIYPRSFKDSNGDGVGDLRGITEKLDYVEWLGIKTIWLSPIYKSPMMDYGYDISDYRDIDSLFGNLDDFKELLDAIHKKGMHLIMDFVPNHTSDQHSWFTASKAGKEPYVDYYVWREGIIDPISKERRPPNDAMSVFGGPAWTWCPERQKYYLHHFLPEQPNLNYKNPRVRREMTDILKYWVDLGVDGFRVDAVPFLGKDESDDSTSTENSNSQSSMVERDGTFAVAGPPVPSYDVISEWVLFLKEHYETSVVDGDNNGSPGSGTIRSVTSKRHVFLCTEGYADLDSVMKYYETGIDFPFNFALVNWTEKSTANDLRRWVNEWMKRMTPTDGKSKKRKHEKDEEEDGSRWPNWVAGNHDQPRVATRLGGSKYVNVVNTLLLTLPGTPTCYQGDELGMLDVPVTYDQCQDPYGKRFGPDHYANYTRDPCRSPMIWKGNLKYGGFSNTADDTAPWLPLSKDKQTFAVDNQRNDPNSYLIFFRRLLQLRDTEAVFHQFGHNLRLLADQDDTYFVYERWAPQGETYSDYLIILNVGHDSDDKFQHLDLSKDIESDLEPTIVMAWCSIDDRQYQEDKSIDLSNIRTKSAEVLIVRLSGKEENEVKRKKRE